MGIREKVGERANVRRCEEAISPGEKLVLALVPLDWMSARLHVDGDQVWEACTGSSARQRVGTRR